MTSTSNSSPSAPSIPSTEPFPLLRLPLELQAQILLHCDYFILKTLHRVCKSIKGVLDGAAFDKALFRPTLKPLSQEELVALAQKSGSSSDSALSLHPAIQASRWRVLDFSEDIFLLNDTLDEFSECFPLDTLAARHESATYPAVHRMEVVIRRYEARPRYGVLIHMDSEPIEHKPSAAGVTEVVTVAELARSLFKLEDRWRGAPVLQFPDPAHRVSTELLRDGSFVVTQVMNDYDYGLDYEPSWDADSDDSRY
ncbi:hypothetical protein A4X09_0g7402 [Tilletia walkeri]|uniref:F-box domain-containing protein n=1 Tax=Tilletia walkeri TaxID=117179 RepID=A0A8X7T250_9BASI|nr:hypothetical protein A4X09_0g7402 [Tilletia walkeri]